MSSQLCVGCAASTHEVQQAFDPVRCTRLYGNPCSACVKIQDLDEQIVRLQHKRQCLLKTLKTQINLQHDPFTRHLPVEIASHIFTIYVEASLPTDACAPLLLAAVCKAWRAIAFCTPRIWTSITIDLNYNQNIPLQVELVTQWLGRSGKLPLCITLDIPVNEGTNEPGRCMKPLFKLLRTYAPRWQQLNLFIPAMTYRSFLSGLRHAPLLESLHLTPSEENFEDPDESMEFRLDITPSLKRLRYSVLYLKMIFLGLDNLTSLEVDDDITLDETLELLYRAPRLVQCNLSRILNSVDDFELPNTPLIHSSLEHLELSPHSFGPSLSILFDRLELPSLLSFKYISKSCHQTLPMDSLISLFNRSQSRITRLSIRIDPSGVIPAESDLIELLESLPTITDLSLELSISTSGDRGMMTDFFLNRFAAVSMQDSTPQDMFLPRLESLRFRGRPSFSWQRLTDLFEGPESTTRICSQNAVAGRFEEISPPVLGRNRTRRPLDYCKIDLLRTKTDPQEYIDKNALSVFVNFQKTAFLDIKDVLRSVDLVESSLEFHGLVREQLWL
ncbi:hypothetical protein BDZ97DRAFT_2061673 [Flammula alnicola]|nr:hypothetical protein BDZ97DRAFT_1763533 [Flammula alnicola]KAF8958477.1 hypothetical protein BDZ97DRAFT_2061673 [Flammula alnicola]